MGYNLSDPLDKARTGCVLPERDMSPHLVIVGGIAHKNSSKVVCVERDQMDCALVPDRSDQAFKCQGERYEVGWSRTPMARTRAL